MTGLVTTSPFSHKPGRAIMWWARSWSKSRYSGSRPVMRRVKSATARIATIATLTTFNIFIFRFSILYDRLARCYTTDRLSAKVRLVERVRGFKELTDEKLSECLKMTSGLDWPCCGSEFILSKAEETLRYAVEKERRQGKLSSDYWFARVGPSRHRVL